MKKQITASFTHLLSLSLLLLAASPASAQSAPIVYQGRLTRAGNPASGPFDMQFKLFDTATVGTGVQQSAAITNSAVPVTNGVFTVSLDFGAAVFDGSPRFLELAVKPGGTAGPYNLLAPRQQVTSIPYAIHSLNASQLEGRPSTSFVQADSSGNVGIGAPAPASDVKLLVNGNTRITTGGSGGYVQIGTPGGETGLSVLGNNRFDLRFDGDTLKLAAGPGLGPPFSHNGISMNTNGNVGIGMESPLLPSQWKLEINGGTRINSGGSGGAVQFSAPNGESGMSILDFDRADVRFDGFALKLVAGFGKDAPPAENGIAITTAGRIGIGTTSPFAKLDVKTPGAADTAILGRATADKSRGVSGDATGASSIGVYGTTTAGSSVGVFGAATAPSSVGVWGSNPNGAAIHADGNATQALDKGGFVKAMAYINPFLPAAQYVVRCYNSQQVGNASSTAPCGIKVTRVSEGFYVIDFGFNVGDRFFSITPDIAIGDGSGHVITAMTREASNNRVFVHMRDTIANYVDSGFYITVY